MTLKPRSSVPIPQQHPLEESRIQRDHDSFKVKAVTKVDRLVQKAILSQIPIVEVGDGRIRVQKRNPTKSSQFNNISPTSSVAKKENVQVEANLTRLKIGSSFDSLKQRQVNNTIVNADNGKEKISVKESNLQSTAFRPIIPRIGVSDDYFEEFKRIQSKMDYVYKPPQAPKYYLWDDTGIGNPKNVEYKLDLDQIEITDLARKGIESSKIRIKVLREAGSKVKYDHVLIGEKTDQNSLIFDQVEENKTGKSSYSAFIVYELNGNKYFTQNRMDNVLLKLKEWLEDATSVLKLHFPLFLHKDDTDTEVWQTIVPEYRLSMKQIRTISFVANDVYLNLSQGISHSENVGYLSIDQARKLYLISCRDSAAIDIPLLGIWMRMDELKLDSCAIHILHFLTNQSIKLMDIGRKVALVCVFISSESNQPLLFECSYVSQGDWPFTIYQKLGKDERFELMKVENCSDWNQYFQSTKILPNVEPMLEAQQKEIPNPEPSATALTNSNDPICHNINIAHPPLLNSTSMNSDNQNLLCLSLLQQQMISLQNQVYQLTLMNQQRWKSDSSMTDLQKSNINPKHPEIEKMKSISVAVNTSFSVGSPKVEGKKVDMISVQTNTTIIKVSECNDGQLRIVEENNMEMPASRIATPAEIAPIDYEQSSPKADVNRDISFAQNVIQKLVSTADQSFIFKEFDDDECSQYAVFGKLSGASPSRRNTIT